MPQDSQRTLRGESREGSRLLIWNDDGNEIRLGLQIPRLLLRFAMFENVHLPFLQASFLLAIFLPISFCTVVPSRFSTLHGPLQRSYLLRQVAPPHPLFCSASSLADLFWTVAAHSCTSTYLRNPFLHHIRLVCVLFCATCIQRHRQLLVQWISVVHS